MFVLLIYKFILFFVNFCVAVLLNNSLFYNNAIHLKFSVYVCICERRGMLKKYVEKRDVVLGDPTFS